jgi:hypothetical protein
VANSVFAVEQVGQVTTAQIVALAFVGLSFFASCFSIVAAGCAVPMAMQKIVSVLKSIVVFFMITSFF